MIILIALIMVFSLLGGWLSRMCGGGPPKLPLGLDQWLYAVPYFLIGLPIILPAWALFLKTPKTIKGWRIWLVLAIAYIAAVTGKRTGHGGGIDMGHSSEEVGAGRDPEKLEYPILWLNGVIKTYWYDALLLGITGIVGTIPAGIILSFFHGGAGLLLAVSGATKPLAYMIGWAVYPNGHGKGIPHLNEATVLAEFLTGFVAYALLAVSFVWAFGLFPETSQSIKPFSDMIMTAAWRNA
jgi:hypothetical protein